MIVQIVSLYKKKEKRRWLFKKGTTTQQGAVKGPALGNAADMADERHAIAVAVATTAAAEAAVATAQAAMEVAKLTREAPTNTNTCPREHYAAIVIQTAFRGYLVCSMYPFFMFLNLSDWNTRKWLDWFGWKGKEGIEGTKRVSEVASFNTRAQCEETGQDDIEMHASSGKSPSPDAWSALEIIPWRLQKIHIQWHC